MAQQPPTWNSNQDERTIPSHPSFQPPQSLQGSQPPQQRLSQATSWWSRFLTWFRGQSRPVQVGSGCAGLIVACIICSCVGSALGSGNTSTSTTANATATIRQGQATQVALGGGTATGTSSPHATATSTPATTKAAATATSKPAPKPTNTPIPRPAATSTPCPGVNCNPWGYNFNPGNYIYVAPSDFCGFFPCINNFSNGTGYVVECQDGKYSKSGGKSGVCSYHGGYWRTLYSH